jgi:hypothetical protein
LLPVINWHDIIMPITGERQYGDST